MAGVTLARIAGGVGDQVAVVRIMPNVPCEVAEGAFGYACNVNVPEADRESQESRRRGLGVVLSAHRDETFQVETENETITVQLKKARKRFDGGEPQTRYMFEVLNRQSLPEDGGQISSDGVDMSGENRIDHIFVSPSLGVRNPVYVLPPESATDHAVHWAEIFWKNP